MACGSGELLFEEKFATLDPAWGFSETDESRTNGADGLTYKLKPNDSRFLLNQASLYDDYEVCVTFTTETPEKAGTYVAVDIWGVDAKNVYEVDILPASGNYSVYRFQNNKLLKPVPLRKHDSINVGTKVTNELSVVVKGSKGSITINGKKVGDFTGKPPEGGSLVGVNFGTYDDDGGPSTITVSDFQVRKVADDGESAGAQ
jgi:hypothetical protein